MLPNQKSTRKALGNITNTGVKIETAPPNSESKQPVPLTLGRKALGDITNSAAPKKFSATEVKQPLLSMPSSKPRSSDTSQAPVFRKPFDPLLARAEVLARAGIEKMAGKGWRQQESERVRDEDLLINKRTKLGTPALPIWHYHSMEINTDLYVDNDDMDCSPEIETKPASLRRRVRDLALRCTPLSDSVEDQEMSSTLEYAPSSPFSPVLECPSLSDLLISSEEEDLLL
ncbi:hypothetical protein CEUSTIGMA_g5290.t1 [Chlamydomonas eustigma]|uniref:Uncharacterized protein n=1 Tax=Chlamydomonas eustigma TaxID=1157962 RepID=A0A250X443_9CHLO|nr:hypothetical protein CEUSTIGMA_g5290.t1 [Chlamydomonas eustigma]|eukprot:GAX77848.1 hypothetical protein CEUSTIGMA_g5290.t1 [Chlamydomonas eustigma]